MPAQSDRLNKLAAALARAQAQLDPVRADEVGSVDDGDHTRAYRYATLTSVWQAIRPALSRNGLAIVQACEPGGADELRLTTTLLHSSGQWIAGTTAIPLPAQTPQGYGSALTYARRYGLAAMVGLCVDQDDDGLAGGRRPDRAPSADGADDPAGGSVPVGEAVSWWKAPCNQASSAQWDAFAQAYARAKHVAVVDRDDVRRDFGFEGDLAEHFGATPLGEIVARGRAAERSSGGNAVTPLPRDRSAPESEAA